MNTLLRAIQKNELNEYLIYQKIAKVVRVPADRAIIERMARQELAHYEMWKKITGQESKASLLKVWFYYVVTRLCGLSFGLKLMEKGEGLIVDSYSLIQKEYPQMASVLKQEQEHESQLLNMINNRALVHAGAIVLGLNDALVELTGALAGFTFALGSMRTIALVGLITGIAASLSMASSSYLAAKEDGEKHPFQAALFTGGAYIIAVVLLIIPYFVVHNPFAALSITLAIAVLIILIFNFYISVSKGVSFRKKFFEMVSISLGLAVVNFGIGWVIKKYIGV